MSRRKLRVTTHARIRARERMNLSYHSEVNKEYNNALRYGHPVDKYRGDFAKFLSYKKNQKKNKARGLKVYKDMVFIYNGKTVLTSYPVPEKFRPTSKYLAWNYKENNVVKSPLVEQIENEYGIDNVNIEIFPPSIEGEVYIALLFIKDVLMAMGTGKSEERAKSSAIKIHYNNIKTKEVNNSDSNRETTKEV